MQTIRQRRGADAEKLVAAHLQRLGWRVLARNVKVGRDEIDIMAVDPGPPLELVFVEVRSARSTAFGAPEERVDSAKVAHMYRAAMAFRRSEHARQLGVGGVPARVDLVLVDLRGPRTTMRRLKGIEPA
jgi:putative endonuclease